MRLPRSDDAFIPFSPRPSVVAVVADDREQLLSFDDGDLVTIQESLERSIERGGTSTLRAELGRGTVRPVTVWLPHTSAVTLLDVRAEADTPLGVWPVRPRVPRHRPRGASEDADPRDPADPPPRGATN